jgi:hypothetical protein
MKSLFSMPTETHLIEIGEPLQGFPRLFHCIPTGNFFRHRPTTTTFSQFRASVQPALMRIQIRAREVLIQGSCQDRTGSGPSEKKGAANEEVEKALFVGGRRSVAHLDHAKREKVRIALDHAIRSIKIAFIENARSSLRFPDR